MMSLFLLLAFCSSALVSLTMRFSEKHVQSKMMMFFGNYLICTALALLFGARAGIPQSTSGLRFAIMLGVVSGGFYLGSFVLLQMNIQRNGVVLSAIFMKLGVLVPTLMAVLVFHETPGLFTMIGFLLALTAIVIINMDNSPYEASEGIGKKGLLVVLLAAGGFTDSFSNIYEHFGTPEWKDLFLLCTFFTAMLLSAALMVGEEKRPIPKDFCWGLLIGLPNYFSARFLLLALSQIPAMIAYPVYNIGAILLVSLAGVLIFREKLGKRKIAGIGMILMALVLLNL